MQIVSAGSGTGWTTTKKCKSCEAVLKADGGDIYYEVRDEDIKAQQYEMDIEGTYYIICPECENEIKVKAREIPANIREFLRTR